MSSKITVLELIKHFELNPRWYSVFGADELTNRETISMLKRLERSREFYIQNDDHDENCILIYW